MTPSPAPGIRWAIFLAIALLALALRLPRLEVRPMHTDEAVNAYILGDLLAGATYRYDPQDRHGPALFLVAGPLARLAGTTTFSGLTETQLRLTPALTGCATILLLGAGVEWFGFIPCLVAALLFAFAPLPVYYSRYFIHETLFVASTLGFLLTGWRATEKASVAAGALAGFCAALMLACKETAVLHFFALGLAAVVSRRFHAGPRLPPARVAVAGLLAFGLAIILLFTWGGRNWPALADLLHAIPNSTARAGGQGHEKPFWYYARLLGGGWSGAVILAMAVVGLFRTTRRPAAGPRFFLGIYALVILAIYSAIPYKTPWLALNFWLPVSLFTGIALEWLWFIAPTFSRRLMILTGIMVVAILTAHDTRERVFQMPADEKNPYAYAQTGDDLLRLPQRLAELARRAKLSEPRIAVVAADPWPLPWYLRKFPQVGFWQPGQDPGPADFFITTTAAAGPLADRLQDFRPEYFGARPNVLLMLWSPAGSLPTPSP